jgi:hypothetical protein
MNTAPATAPSGSPSTDEVTVQRWKHRAGDGDIDERAARIAADLRARLGMSLPPCAGCGFEVVLVDGPTRAKPKLVHASTRDPRCYPDEHYPDLAECG